MTALLPKWHLPSGAVRKEKCLVLPWVTARKLERTTPSVVDKGLRHILEGAAFMNCSPALGDVLKTPGFWRKHIQTTAPSELTAETPVKDELTRKQEVY